MKNKKTRIKFSAPRAVRMYGKGTGVSDIAVAMGYPRGSGQNRVRGALVKAGVYQAKAMAPVEMTKTKNKLSMAVPTDRATFLRECYLFVASRYNKLHGRARSNFVPELSGLLLSGIAGAESAQRITPVPVPEGFTVAAAA